MVDVIKCNKCGNEILTRQNEKRWHSSIYFYPLNQKDKKAKMLSFKFDLCEHCKDEILKSLKIPADTTTDC